MKSASCAMPIIRELKAIIYNPKFPFRIVIWDARVLSENPYYLAIESIEKYVNERDSEVRVLVENDASSFIRIEFNPFAKF